MNRDYNNTIKQIRAEVIKEYLNKIGQNTCVCFSCGNASGRLNKVGLNTVQVIDSNIWFTPAEIQNMFKVFDATSGHLPMFLMSEIASRLRKLLKQPENGTKIACGSGETFVCMSMAWPNVKLIPIYNIDHATKFNELSPLNDLVKSLSKNN
jgi:hypothetical protein